MSSIFNPDNAFFSFMGKLFDLFVLGFVFLAMFIPAFCFAVLGANIWLSAGEEAPIPAFTVICLVLAVICLVVVAPSFISIYYATVKSVRRQRSYAVKEYFRSFKMNLKQGLRVSVIFLIIGGLLVWDFMYVFALADPENAEPAGEAAGSGIFSPTVMFWLFVMITYFFIGTFSYMFPVLSRFQMTTKNALRFSFGLAAKHVWCTILSVLLWGAVGFAVFLFPPVVLLIPGPAVFVESLMMEKVLKIYVLKTVETQKAELEGSGESTEEDALVDFSDSEGGDETAVSEPCDGEGQDGGDIANGENEDGKKNEPSWKDSLEDPNAVSEKDEWYLE